MKRRPSKHLRPARPLGTSHARAEAKGDGTWVVRSIAGQNAQKTYRCPGCNHDIRPGVPHVVAWPHDPGPGRDSAVVDRRHWHTSCWQRRR